MKNTIYNIGEIRLPVNDGVAVEWETGKVHTKKNGQVVRETTSREFYERDRAKAEEFLKYMRENGHPEAQMYDCIF